MRRWVHFTGNPVFLYNINKEKCKQVQGSPLAVLLCSPSLLSPTRAAAAATAAMSHCVKMTSLVSSSSAFVVQGSRLEHRPCCCTEPEGDSREAPVITEVVCPTPLSKLVALFFFFNCISPVLSKYCNMFYSASCRVLSSIFLFLVIFLSFLSVMAKTGSIINKFNIIRFSNNLANSLIWLQHWRVFDRIS